MMILQSAYSICDVSASLYNNLYKDMIFLFFFMFMLVDFCT